MSEMSRNATVLFLIDITWYLHYYQWAGLLRRREFIDYSVFQFLYVTGNSAVISYVNLTWNIFYSTKDRV